MSKPVYAIPPSFKNDKLDCNSTIKYLEYLENKGATRVLTTAGTSQFNLLSLNEIFQLNKCLVDNFTQEKILGLPALSLKHLKVEIKKLNELKSSNIKLLILFPERYYSDDQILEFFDDICALSLYPVYLHGNPLRKGMGGTYEYTNSLLEKLSRIDNFEGIKEEYSSLDLSIKSIQNLDLDIIVAGGSMRRFWTLSPFGATSFLTGVGNFNPIHSEEFYNAFNMGKYSKCIDIIQNIETPLFDTFMKVGWHASMREALKTQGYILENRKPFITLSNTNNQEIIKALNKIL
jgi:dihydrodipicolinate synthase/N-acetylneuraminate lyase